MKNSWIHSLPKEADGDVKGVPLEMGSNLDLVKNAIYKQYASGWQLVVKNFPLVTNSSAKGKSIDSSTQYKYLKSFILNSIFKITTEMHDSLV